MGRSNIVGKPMVQLMLQKEGADCTVTCVHSHTENVAEECRTADILIAALGQPEFVKADMVKPGAVVVDVGTTRVPDPSRASGYRLSGDVDFSAVSQVASAITPVPGGGRADDYLYVDEEHFGSREAKAQYLNRISRRRRADANENPLLS